MRPKRTAAGQGRRDLLSREAAINRVPDGADNSMALQAMTRNWE